MQEQLANQDFTKFHPLDKKLLERVDKMLAEDIAKLMVGIDFRLKTSLFLPQAMVPLEEEMSKDRGTDKIEGGAFDGVMESKTPFMYKGGEGINAGVGEVEWVISKDRFDNLLMNLEMKMSYFQIQVRRYIRQSQPY